ncbi:store-operated calcium entry-associated regulatory factor isoform X2 [Lagopus leucura]|uniref:store-operated calcium entry-associated regulatory factor isoform X2 n=1 Tax=Lagopus leucura TaxID=30410 RepID=UPI001C67E9BD|nr:store-operated calcium entry-associated regulatory factor isoform X2 [Lagopus leucura]
MAADGAVAAFFLLLCAAAGTAWGWDQQGVLLRDVQVLTLHRGRYTTARRTAAVPQLQCTGGSAGCSDIPEVVQCYNKGWDGYDVQWQCKADLEDTLRFGQIEVSCEGYNYPDDPYILRGSCSLLFRLELTKEDEWKAKNSGGFGSGYYTSTKDSSHSGAGTIFVIVLLILAFGVYKFFLSNQQPQQSFGDGDGFARPFWQSHQAPPPPGFKFSSTDNGFGTRSSHETNSGPGFWTGLGAGGLLGYLAGSQRAQSRSSYFNTWGDPTAVPPVYRQSSNSTQGSSTRTASDITTFDVAHFFQSTYSLQNYLHSSRLKGFQPQNACCGHFRALLQFLGVHMWDFWKALGELTALECWSR